LEKVLPEARRQFNGSEWADNWRRWEARLKKSEEQAASSEKIQTPRH